MNKVYIVEDDPVIAGSVAGHLEKWQMKCRCAQNFEKITEEVQAYQPDIILLDIKLPYYNGFYWCAEIRKLSRVPIVFLSSADDNMNIVMAMSRGADDFIAKPFDTDVLVAKIQALLRRTYSFGTPGSLLEHKGAVLNPSKGILTWDSTDIELTKNEQRILEILFEHAGKTVSRDAIITHLWKSDSFVDDNTLTVNITRLRKKLDTAGLHDFIITRKGLGYIIQ